MRVFGILRFIGLVFMYVSDYILSALTETSNNTLYSPNELKTPKISIFGRLYTTETSLNIMGSISCFRKYIYV